MKTYGRRRGASQTTESVDVVNLDEVCRLCLTREERDENRVPIFERDTDDGEPTPLALRIMACVALEVVEDDGLPNTICRPCHYQLENYYVFRKKCTNSDIKLRTHLKRLAEGDDPDEDKEAADVVGSTVTFAIPEEDEADMEIDSHIDHGKNINEITLPPDSHNATRKACTLKQEPLEDDDKDEDRQLVTKKVVIFDDNRPSRRESPETVAQDLIDETVVAEDGAEKSLSLRVLPSTEPALTHVEVTTEDGSVLLMELSTVDSAPEKSNESHDNREMLIFKCDECDKSFSRLVELKRHSSVHRTQRGISCGVCEKWFPTHSAFVRHERVHTGVKPFQCSICEKKFIQKEILLRHMLIHSDIKPFNCHLCKKGFIQKESLKTHMEKHQPTRTVRLHQCPLCKKVFCHASGLSRHILVHSGVGFKCVDCEKVFNDQSSLRRHLKVTGHQRLPA